MNKIKFSSILSKTLSCSEEKCLLISEILEKNFFLNKKNKNKIISEFTIKLNCTSKKAIIIYDAALKIIYDEIKYKLKHPFKSIEK